MWLRGTRVTKFMLQIAMAYSLFITFLLVLFANLHLYHCLNRGHRNSFQRAPRKNDQHYSTLFNRWSSFNASIQYFNVRHILYIERCEASEPMLIKICFSVCISFAILISLPQHSNPETWNRTINSHLQLLFDHNSNSVYSGNFEAFLFRNE